MCVRVCVCVCVPCDVCRVMCAVMYTDRSRCMHSGRLSHLLRAPAGGAHSVCAVWCVPCDVGGSLTSSTLQQGAYTVFVPCGMCRVM